MLLVPPAGGAVTVRGRLVFFSGKEAMPLARWRHRAAVLLGLALRGAPTPEAPLWTGPGSWKVELREYDTVDLGQGDDGNPRHTFRTSRDATATAAANAEGDGFGASPSLGIL